MLSDWAENRLGSAYPHKEHSCVISMKSDKSTFRDNNRKPVSNVMKHAVRYNILSDIQHGFRSRRSCETQLIQFTHDLVSNLSNGTQTDVLIMDFAKAFDKVDHPRLLSKRMGYGICGQTLAWITSFLSGRSQSVVLDGETSSPISVSSGVPQGSVLGPCLFLFYINDIADKLTCQARLFADDTIIYMAIRKNQDSMSLQNDLDRLADWEKTWLMEFHPQKCKVIRVYRGKSPINFSYSLHGQTLEIVDCVKYLGVTFSSDLSWNAHVDAITAKANKTLGFLRRNLRVSNRKAKECAYKSFVRPIVEYSASVWDPHTARNIDKIDMVQRRAARYVCNRYRQTSSVSEMLSQLNWRSLQDRRCDMKLCMFYKIVNGLVEIDTSKYMIPSRQTRSSRHSHSQSYCIPHSRLNCHLYSFFPSTIRLWNGLGQNVVDAQSVAAFHSKVSSLSHSH